MKKVLISLLLLFTLQGYSQMTFEEVATKTIDALEKAPNLNYKLERIYDYPSSNYHVERLASVHFKKRVCDSIFCYDLFATSDQYDMVYTSNNMFSLNHTDSTIELERKLNKSSLESVTFLSYGILAIKNTLPLILANKDAQKNITDTVVNNKGYYKLSIYTVQSYYGYHKLELVTEPNFDRSIYFLIDKETFLPYQYYVQFKVEKEGIDYLRNTFKNLNTKEFYIEKEKLAFGYYMPSYKIKLDKKRPLISIGSMFPETTLLNYSKNKTDTFQITKRSNKYTVLDFWIKSCGPCIAALPKLNSLAAKLKEKEIDFVSINCFDPKSDMAFFYNKYKPNYPMLYNGTKLSNALGITFYPTLIILDKDKKVVYAGGYDEARIAKFFENK